jgi:hypothetical protein
MDNPTKDDILSFREWVQERYSYGVTFAQDHCSGLIHANRRSWQKWETGERKMHPAFWELVQLKSGFKRLDDF